MKKTILSLLLPAALLPAMAKSNDGVIITVNGEEIPSSEFEYLFKKNLNQQVEPQSVEEYLELFKIYRLKVAEAKTQGKDTTETFRNEIAQYKKDLLVPYITDSAFIYNFIDIEAARDKEEVEASHIMMYKTRDEASTAEKRQKLQHLRDSIINGASFEAIAAEFSEDLPTGKNGGSLGYIIAGRYPYAFESAIYDTPQGEITEIFETPFAMHIAKSGKRRPSRGKVDVAHIMKAVAQDASEEDVARSKEVIDSLYNIVIADPESFAQVAIENSDDPGSAQRGGRLYMFGAGEMVPEFEEVAFALNEGEISKPFRSQFGWHFIKKYGAKPTKDYAEIKDEVLKRITNPQDPRYTAIENHKYEMLAAKHPEVVNEGDEKAYREALLEAEENSIYNTNADYRNLINEYTDGSLLYEASVYEVWNRASQDTEGLNDYFETHRDNYRWDKAYAKGILVRALSDSIVEKVKFDIQNMPSDSIVAYVKENFPKKAVAEKFLVTEGTNAMIDNIMYGAEAPKKRGRGMEYYFIIDGRLLEAPEEMSDVKPAVIADYQEELEKRWVASLQNKYPVEVNKKELKKLKAKLEKK